MHFTILIKCAHQIIKCALQFNRKSKLPKPLLHTYFWTIKLSKILVVNERGKPEYSWKNLSEQSQEPRDSIHMWHRVRKFNLCHIEGNGIRNGKIRLVVSEILWSPCHNSFERFLHYSSKVLGVVRGSHF